MIFQNFKNAKSLQKLLSLFHITVNIFKNRKKKNYKNISGSRIINDNERSEISVNDDLSNNMNQETRVEIRTGQRDRFRKAIKILMASKGYVNNEEVAKMFGFKKSAIDNLMVKRANVRVPTLADFYQMNQVQNQLKKQGQKASWLPLWKIIFGEDEHPQVKEVKEELEKVQEENRRLQLENEKLRGKIEVYKEIKT